MELQRAADERLSAAIAIGEETLLQKVKAAHPELFDQVLVESHERKKYYYVRYHAISLERHPLIYEFPCYPELEASLKENVNNSSPMWGKAKRANLAWLIDNIRSLNIKSRQNANYSLQALPFVHLPVETQGRNISEGQPYYIIPAECSTYTCNTCAGDCYVTCPEPECQGRHVYPCNKCKATGIITCSPCEGRGQLRCPGCNGRGRNACNSCNGGRVTCYGCWGAGGRNLGTHGNVQWETCRTCWGNRTIACSNCQGGWRTCTQCRGATTITCSSCSGHGRVTCPKCKGHKSLTCPTCYGDNEHGRYGKVNCPECRTMGRMARLSFIDSRISYHDDESIAWEGTHEHPGDFSLQRIQTYADTEGALRETWYAANLGVPEDKHDAYTMMLKTPFEKGMYKDKYPLLLQQAMYYELIPCITFHYHHFISNTRHDLSIFNYDKKPEIVFHSRPEAVAGKETFGQRYAEWMRKAFSTKSYNAKRDRRNELILLLHLAKCDGEVTEHQKKVIAGFMTKGFDGFTRVDKDHVLKLMSTKVSGTLHPQFAIFTNQQKKDEVTQHLMQLLPENGRHTEEEQTKLEEIRTLIGANNKPNPVIQFFTTWQVSAAILLILALVSVAVITYSNNKSQENRSSYTYPN